jgi:hypothetical protein
MLLHAEESLMPAMLRLLPVAAVFSIFAAQGIAQSNTASIVEPGVYKLSELYRQADKVALVTVISGDTEAYEVPIYKAQVVRAFKGISANEVIYFGPYLGVQLGSEYILFLENVSKPIQPKDKAVSGYGVVKYGKVFDEGYSSMVTSYECVFNGRSPSQACDYAVRICTDYIVAPKSLSTSPSEEITTPFGCRWARRDRFIGVLNEMSESVR